ncbi:MAG: phage portal protein [Oscillospiraceae bacterium]|nr:phage portal protein [Oscillospiraceae bacterium]
MDKFDISIFLKQNVPQPENVKFAPSPRIKDKNGKPVEFELRAITPDEDEAIQSDCVKWEIPEGETRRVKTFDQVRYLTMLAVESTVYPNLKSEELQNSYGIFGEEALLKALLCVSGEYSAYQLKVQRVNNEVPVSELAEEIKN